MAPWPPYFRHLRVQLSNMYSLVRSPDAVAVYNPYKGYWVTGQHQHYPITHPIVAPLFTVSADTEAPSPLIHFIMASVVYSLHC